MHRLVIPKWLVVLLVSGAALVASSAGWTWVQVGDGIEYQSFTTSGPNNLFVCRMARNNTNAIIESMIGSGYIGDGTTETVRNQASRYDEAINWWGQEWGKRNDVVVAINGDFFSSGIPTGGQHYSGWHSKRYGNFGGFSGIGYRLDRTPFIGSCINNIASNQTVYFLSNGTEIRFDGINTTRSTDQLIIYTPQYNTKTPTVSSGVEVLVELPRPMIMASGGAGTVGTIKQIWQNSGAHFIPFDHVILSADGTKATQLLNAAVVGQQVRISQLITDYNAPDTCGQNGCNYATGVSWANTYASVGQNYWFVRNGVLYPPDSNCHPGYIGLTNLNPRTAVAYNNDYIYFIVCDGRSANSVGMGLAQLGQWCIDTLQVTEAVNLDGGGSSTMVVNGVVKNVPSDGSERAVANGFAMVNVLPKLQSTMFSAGQTVTVNSNSTSVRLGPGTDYGTITTVSKNTTGTIVDHAQNGVYAKNNYWWKVDFGSGTVGWVAETLLISDTSAPSITLHPVSQTACPGDTAKFRIAATGRATLSYRWQKNGADLSDGGHYSGTLTPELIISNIDSNDWASYRCRVSNSYGTTYSDPATLSQGAQPLAPTALPPSNIGTDTIRWNWSAVPGAQYYKLWTAASGGTQIGGAITDTFYVETAMDPGTSYTRYVESWGCGGSSTRTQLGPASTLARPCPENGDFESGFTNGIANRWIKLPDDGTSVFAQETIIKRSGTSSQRIEDPVGGQSYTGWLYQKLNVQPNRQYVLSYYSYRTGAGQSTGFVTGIGCDVNGGTNLVSIGETSAPFNQWVFRQSAPFTSGPQGMITIGVRGGQNGGDTVGYVEDFVLAPAPPTSSGGTTTICNGQSTTIWASGGFGGTPSELHWYTGPNGTGIHVGTGTSLLVSPTVTTTYYPRWEAASNCGTCCNSADGPSVTVTVLNCQPTVASITPSTGPNTGQTNITNLAGTNFVPGATVKLARTGYPDIAASNVNVESSTKITCVFDLTDKKTGLWDVVVTNPGPVSATLAKGFGITIADNKSAVGTTIRSLTDAIAAGASLNFRFRVWGAAEAIDSSSFWLDDGSGTRVKVFAPGYSISSTYVSAVGTVDVSSGTPVLVSAADRVTNY